MDQETNNKLTRILRSLWYGQSFKGWQPNQNVEKQVLRSGWVDCEVVTLAGNTWSELSRFIAHGVYYLRCLLFIVNLTGFKITMDTCLWGCPWECYQRNSTEKGRPTQRVGMTSPGVGGRYPDWVKGERELSISFHLSLLQTVDWQVHQAPAATPSLPWWAVPSRCEPKQTNFFHKCFLLGIWWQQWEEKLKLFLWYFHDYFDYCDAVLMSWYQTKVLQNPWPRRHMSLVLPPYLCMLPPQKGSPSMGQMVGEGAFAFYDSLFLTCLITKLGAVSSSKWAGQKLKCAPYACLHFVNCQHCFKLSL